MTDPRNDLIAIIVMSERLLKHLNDVEALDDDVTEIETAQAIATRAAKIAVELGAGFVPVPQAEPPA
jgi:hypothetical protein